MTVEAPPATTRRLATIETILDLAPIEGADRIELATVRGWNVIVQKGLYEVGSPVIYFEVDSALPLDDERFKFLGERSTRKFEGRDVHVVKTMKMRGVYSQGLCMPVDEFPEIETADVSDGNVTDLLGVVKFEKPVPAQLAGKIRRNTLPWWIPRTDEERIQNIPGIVDLMSASWVATEKVDGSSMTVYVDLDAPEGEQEGVCSRNLDLKEAEGNAFWKTARELRLHDQLRATAGVNVRRFAYQGELFGEGIQGNPLGMNGIHFRLFNFLFEHNGITHAPPRAYWGPFEFGIAAPVYDMAPPPTVAAAVKQVEGLKSLIKPDRKAEGVVWRSMYDEEVHLGAGTRRASVKVISPDYLLKHDR